MRTHVRLCAERVFATGRMTQAEELRITRCMLLGCTFEFDNYGHPEREQARKYHKCIGECPPQGHSHYRGMSVVGYGHNQAEAAWDWLRRCGMNELRDRA